MIYISECVTETYRYKMSALEQIESLDSSNRSDTVAIRMLWPPQILTLMIRMKNCLLHVEFPVERSTTICFCNCKFKGIPSSE